MDLKRFNTDSKLFFVLGFINFVNVIVVKLFLKNPDLGARFKNFNGTLYISDIYLYIGLIWILFSLIYLTDDFFNRNIFSKKLTKLHFYLTMPSIVILIFVPVLDTYFPTQPDSGGSILETLFALIGSISFLAFLGGIVIFLLNIIRGLIQIPRLIKK
jgi:hypothetical protein